MLTYSRFITLVPQVPAPMPMPQPPTHVVFKFREPFASQLTRTKVSHPILPHLPTTLSAFHVRLRDRWIAVAAQRFTEPQVTPSGKTAFGFMFAIIINDNARYHFYYQPLGGDFLTTLDTSLFEHHEGVNDNAHIVTNILLYMFSDEPILSVLPSPNTRGERDDFKRQFGCISDLTCMLIGPEHTPRCEHNVKGHWRWQPHGPQLSKLKLIWIDAYVRNQKSHAL